MLQGIHLPGDEEDGKLQMSLLYSREDGRIGRSGYSGEPYKTPLKSYKPTIPQPAAAKEPQCTAVWGIQE